MNRIGFALGAVFGFLMTAGGLSDYDVIHRMLRLQEPDLFLLMGSAVGTAAPILWLMQRSRWKTAFGGPLQVRQAPVERRNVLGAMVFGSGWAVAGTCPGPAVAMTAAGNVLGVVVMAGLLTGVFLYGKVAEGSAASDEGATARNAALAAEC